MAKSDFTEETGIEIVELKAASAMTGGENSQRFLCYSLTTSMLRAEQIDIIVSFLMESGVRMILEALQSALDRGAKIRILTGNYLGITQPSALYLSKRKIVHSAEPSGLRCVSERTLCGA